MTGIYCRVSTEEQATQGSSLEVQEAECRARAAAEGWDDVTLYVDAGVSGTRLDRPALRQLLEDARRGNLRRLICADPDRLARDLGHLLAIMDQLHRCGVEVRFVHFELAPSADGRLLLALRGAIAEFETHRIRQRMLSGKRARAREGRPAGGGQAIYGYRYDPVAKRFARDPAEAAVVREVFRLALDCGTGAIARQLEAWGIPPRRGGRWSQRTVYGMLRNPTYLGRMPQMKGLGYLTVPPLVGQEEWRAAQEALDRRRGRPPGPARHPYLLTGRAICGRCGGRVRAGFGRPRRAGPPVTYYACSRRRDPHCGAPYYRSDRVDGAVWRGLGQWLAQVGQNPPWARAWPEGDRVDRTASLERELRRLAGQRQRLIRALRAGALEPAELGRQVAALDAQVALVVAERDRLRLEAEVRRQGGSAQGGGVLAQLASAVLHEELPLSWRRQILEVLQARVVLGPGGRAEVRLGVGPLPPTAPAGTGNR